MFHLLNMNNTFQQTQLKMITTNWNWKRLSWHVRFTLRALITLSGLSDLVSCVYYACTVTHSIHACTSSFVFIPNSRLAPFRFTYFAVRACHVCRTNRRTSSFHVHSCVSHSETLNYKLQCLIFIFSALVSRQDVDSIVLLSFCACN